MLVVSVDFIYTYEISIMDPSCKGQDLLLDLSIP